MPHARVRPSIVPSQSSSTLLHVSADGPVPLHVPHEPAVQSCVPAVHAPTSVPQTRVSDSSISESQSLSRPSQISADGTQPEHTPPSSMTPSQSLSRPSQTSVEVGPHAPQPLRTPSSTTPLQLLSRPSQAVSTGAAQSVHAGRLTAVLLQSGGATPLAVLQNLGRPSSAIALQLSSRLLQDSTRSERRTISEMPAASVTRSFAKYAVSPPTAPASVPPAVAMLLSAVRLPGAIATPITYVLMPAALSAVAALTEAVSDAAGVPSQLGAPSVMRMTEYGRQLAALSAVRIGVMYDDTARSRPEMGVGPWGRSSQSPVPAWLQ